MRWPERDRRLAEALILHEASLCGGCGHPIGQAWDPDSNGWWEAKETTCEACAEIERRQRDKKEPEPGVRVRAVLDVDGWRSAPQRSKQARTGVT